MVDQGAVGLERVSDPGNRMMSEQLVECVPNFSEGRDKSIIKSICDAIESVSGVQLLHIDLGADLNRSVVTFVGSPEGILESAFLGIERASELIDMRTHKGIHPRMGATDVCPLIPFKEMSLEDCILLSKTLGKRVGEELGIPVYLYEQSARVSGRRNLADVRAGEYEGLAMRIADPVWKPDFGPPAFNARAGATAIGARDFLIAFNMNLNTQESIFAKDIALELRSKGRTARRGNTEPIYLLGEEILQYSEGHYPCGMDDFVGSSIRETAEHCRKVHGYDLINLLCLNGIDPRNPEGRPVKIPGKFTHCKAMGWFVPEYHCSQVSLNLTNFKVTSMQTVFEETCRLAAVRGLEVTGSEIVGMVPYEAMLDTGCYYRQSQSRASVRDLLEAAVTSLRLTHFELEKRVLGLPDDLDSAIPPGPEFLGTNE